MVWSGVEWGGVQGWTWVGSGVGVGVGVGVGWGAVEPGGSDDGMTITIASFSLYRYVHLQTWMNLQLRYHLGFALISLLCHHRLYPIVPCAFSPYP